MYYFESGSVNVMLLGTKQLLYRVRSTVVLVESSTADGD